MQEFFHNLTINGRSGITVTGVESVAAFSETQIVLVLVDEKKSGKSGEKVTVTGTGLKITGLVNNSNLGEATDAETVLNSVSYADEVSRVTGLPVVMTTVKNTLYPELEGRIENLFPLKLQKKIL